MVKQLKRPPAATDVRSRPPTRTHEEDGAVDPGDPVVRLVRRAPVYVFLDASLRAVAETMAEESIGAVLVRAPHGPAGIVSERDVLLALADGAHPSRERARDVMTADLAVVPSTATVREAAKAMLAYEIRHLGVTTDEMVIGIVSMRDVLAVLAADA